MVSLEEVVEGSYLFDFYGELLTEHQRSIYQSFVFENYSLSEIASEQGISRQGVHDLIKRCDKLLISYEDKLHLVERFQRLRKQVDDLIRVCEDTKLSKEQRIEVCIQQANILREDL